MTVTPPEFGGCPWPIDSACLTSAWEELAPEVQDRAVALASATLHRLTGYRVSNCPITVRVEPQRHRCFVPNDIYTWRSATFLPGIDALGTWRNACTGPCEHDHQGIVLDPPVGRVDSVTVDGQVIPDTSYRLTGSVLVWLEDTPAPWLDGEVIEVTYLNAYPVDGLGAYAAGVLAMEFAKACSGAKGCRLPMGVTAVVRQGVTFEVGSGAFPGGLTGIREVDAFITLWNPNGLQRPTTVYSPDRTRPRIGG